MPRAPKRRSNLSAPHRSIIPSGPWEDPAHLAEGYFRGRLFADEAAETIILAWLSILPRGTRFGDAAMRLKARLTAHNASPNARQQRFLDLLTFVARHR